MTQLENEETSNHPRSRYDRCDPHYLRELREAAGMDLVVLARTACLSLAQVRALESENGGDVFYSDTIKRQAYKRLLMILGAEPPTVEVPVALRDAHLVAEAHLNTLDQIVAMSHQPPMNFTWTDRVRESASFLMVHKQLLGALLLLMSAVVLFVLYGPLQVAQVATPPTVATSAVVTTPAESPVVTVAPASDALAAVAPAVSLPVASASVVAAADSASPKTTTSAACVYSADALPQLAPFVARKEGGYVYFVSNANADVCVVDGNKQATLLTLKAGEGRTVSGAGPWQVSGTQLKHVQIYFQGGRVTLPEDIQRLKLVEQAVTR